jgi:hypothetical protein
MNRIPNISRTRYGFRAYVKVGKLQDDKRFKPDTPIKTMRDWVDEARVALKKLPQSPAKKDTFRADGQRYLALEEIKQLLSFQVATVRDPGVVSAHRRHLPRQNRTGAHARRALVLARRWRRAEDRKPSRARAPAPLPPTRRLEGRRRPPTTSNG